MMRLRAYLAALGAGWPYVCWIIARLGSQDMGLGFLGLQKARALGFDGVVQWSYHRMALR